MYKAFDLQFCPFPDLPDLFKRELSGRNNACHSAILCEPCAVCIGDGHLGAGMDVQIREIFPYKFHDAKILYDNGVKTVFIIRQQIVIQAVRFGCFKKSIDCHI